MINWKNRIGNASFSSLPSHPPLILAVRDLCSVSVSRCLMVVVVDVFTESCWVIWSVKFYLSSSVPNFLFDFSPQWIRYIVFIQTLSCVVYILLDIIHPSRIATVYFPSSTEDEEILHWRFLLVAIFCFFHLVLLHLPLLCSSVVVIIARKFYLLWFPFAKNKTDRHSTE